MVRVPKGVNTVPFKIRKEKKKKKSEREGRTSVRLVMESTGRPLMLQRRSPLLRLVSRAATLPGAIDRM